MVTLIRNFLVGIVLAFGRIIPSVGIQTTSVVIGVYNEIIDFFFHIFDYLQTALFFLLARKSKLELQSAMQAIPWQFGIPTTIGIAVTLSLATKILPDFYATYPLQTSAVAFGLLLAAIMIPLKEMYRKTWIEYAIATITFVVFWLILSLKPFSSVDEPALILFFVGGVVTSFAALLPGLPTILPATLLGIYPTLLKIVSSFDIAGASLYSFSALLLFIIGFAGGFWVFVRLFAKVLNKYKTFFMAFILGEMAASIRVLWPFVANNQPVAPWQMPLTVFTQQVIIIGVSFAVVSLIRQFTDKKSPLATSFGDTQRTVITS